MNQHDYVQQVPMKHTEVLLKVDSRTGETTDVTPDQRKGNKLPDDSQVFQPDSLFHKMYNNSWLMLQRFLKPTEFKAAWILSMRAHGNANTLEPIGDGTAIQELAEILMVSRNMVSPILKKLFNLGVYGSFEVVDKNIGYTKYWVLNPYLSFTARTVKNGVVDLFKNTHVAQAHSDPNYNPGLPFKASN